MIKLLISLLLASQVSTAMAKDRTPHEISRQEHINKIRSDLHKKMEKKRKEIRSRISKSKCKSNNNRDLNGNNINICQSSKENIVSITQYSGNSNISISSTNNPNNKHDESCTKTKDRNNLNISCNSASGTINIKQENTGNIKIVQDGKIIASHNSK